MANLIISDGGMVTPTKKSSRLKSDQSDAKFQLNEFQQDLPDGVKESIIVRNAILETIKNGQVDNSFISMRAKYNIDGKPLDRKRAVQLREERSYIFDMNRKHKKR